MASDLSFAEYVADQIRGAGNIVLKKMFGEYAVYCDGKVVALICDNQFFVKPTKAGRDFLGTVVEAKPYPSVKTLFFFIGDELDDSDKVARLVQVSWAELAFPKPKPPKKIKPKKSD